MNTKFEEVMELRQVSASDDRAAYIVPTPPVVVCDSEYDGERWDGLS